MSRSLEGGGPKHGGAPVEFEFGPKNEAEWRAGWGELRKTKPQDTPWLIRRGRLLGIPDDELRGLARAAIDQHVKEQWYGLAHAIMKAAEVGSEEERAAMGERVYQQHMGKGGYPGTAAMIAKELWGENSPQYLSAQKAAQQRAQEFQKGQEKAEPLMRLPRDATFDDFSTAWQEMVAEEGMGIDVEIEAEMREVFGEQLAQTIIDFLNGKDDSLRDRKLLNFFKEQGFGEAQLGEVFGVKFRKRSSRKGG